MPISEEAKRLIEVRIIALKDNKKMLIAKRQGIVGEYENFKEKKETLEAKVAKIDVLINTLKEDLAS